MRTTCHVYLILHVSTKLDAYILRRRIAKNVDETKVISISRKTSPLQIMTDEKQLENVEYFNYLDSKITNDARRTREIKVKAAMVKQYTTGRKLFSPANWT